jgi:hypothetical protein
MPESILAERNSYLIACRRTPEGRRNVEKVMEVIDALIKWSLDRPSILEFAYALDKDQKTLGFKKRADGNLIWETYPDGERTDAKLSFFTRAGMYMSSEAQTNLLRRFLVDLRVTRKIDLGSVMELPVKRFAMHGQLERLLDFVSWACDEPAHFGLHDASIEPKSHLYPLLNKSSHA